MERLVLEGSLGHSKDSSGSFTPSAPLGFDQDDKVLDGNFYLRTDQERHETRAGLPGGGVGPEESVVFTCVGSQPC